MEKRIEDYLHLYIGCEVVTIENNKGYLTGIHGEYGAEVQLIIDGNALEYPEYPMGIKLILRPLSDMTEEECEHVSSAAWQGKPTILVNAELTAYYLKCGFDLFGLIEAGLAIDKTKL